MKKVNEGIKKLIILLEDIGSQLSRIDKVPSDKKQAWYIIYNNISRIKEVSSHLLERGTMLEKNLTDILQELQDKDLILYWSMMVDRLKPYIKPEV
jgi:hypothetical protein